MWMHRSRWESSLRKTRRSWISRKRRDGSTRLRPTETSATYAGLPIPIQTSWGDAKDFGAAARCLRKAADQDYPEAQRKLARAYEIGEGVDKDAAAAAKWYLKAAEAGDAEAQYNLAMMYSDGEGVEANPEEAKKWFHAAEIPRKKDQPRDGSIQEELAGRKDRIAKTGIMAYAYFLIAQECGNPGAQVCLESVAGTMTKNEIAESRMKADLVLNKLRAN